MSWQQGQNSWQNSWQNGWGNGNQYQQQARLHWSGLTTEELRAAGEAKKNQDMEQTVSRCMSKLVPQLMEKMSSSSAAGPAGSSGPRGDSGVFTAPTPLRNEVDPALVDAVAERLSKRKSGALPAAQAPALKRTKGSDVRVPKKTTDTVHPVILLHWQASLGCARLPKASTTDSVVAAVLPDGAAVARAAESLKANAAHPLVKQLGKKPQKENKLRVALMLWAEDAVEACGNDDDEDADNDSVLALLTGGALGTDARLNAFDVAVVIAFAYCTRWQTPWAGAAGLATAATMYLSPSMPFWFRALLFGPGAENPSQHAMQFQPYMHSAPGPQPGFAQQASWVQQGYPVYAWQQNPYATMQWQPPGYAAGFRDDLHGRYPRQWPGQWKWE
ncbi:unnamed protein product [Prorocentrum cordatum]|uniref:Uncharacterized protein n=1 Tax=Prorocentrum cordatum TaxID=2364126 RepID=A0ABN9TQ28_9DINO|nr:unnamed protein product [Polarella glacialis]